MIEQRAGWSTDKNWSQSRKKTMQHPEKSVPPGESSGRRSGQQHRGEGAAEVRRTLNGKFDGKPRKNWLDA
jgi:hypothetical protein